MARGAGTLHSDHHQILKSQSTKNHNLYGTLARFHKGDKRSYKLTEEDVVFLASHTNYTKEEIREWFRLVKQDKKT